MNELTDAKKIEIIAAVCHAVNAAYCLGMGDSSQVDWGDVPKWQKDSAVNGVCGVIEDGNGPEESHKSWLKVKEEAGWTYSSVKDPGKRTHPCMVPYSDLSDEQKLKDDIFINTVKTMRKMLDV